MSLVQTLPSGPLDIVGDIHGEQAALLQLLRHLGYDARGNHPEGRTLVFLGDFVDRGPDSPGVIGIVHQLVTSGKAVAIAGNHEINLLRNDPKDGSGWFFDARLQSDLRKYPCFARPHDPAERSAIVHFLRDLPVALEREDLRIVHAAWSGAAVEQARRQPLGGLRAAYDQWEAQAAQAAQALEARKADRARWARELERLRVEVERAERELAAADQAIAAAETPAPEVDTALLEARRAELRAEYLAANTRISWEAAHRAHQAQVERADADAARLQAEADAKTVALAEIDARKAKLLAAAEMPVPGLEVGDDGLLLGGVPFGQASQAERLRCSLAIAMRQSPRLRDVWVRDGALLDDDGIELVRTMAEDHDCRVWLEVVGEDEPGAVVFRDGKIVSAPGDAPAKPAAVLQLVPSTLPTNPESSTDDEPDLFA